MRPPGAKAVEDAARLIWLRRGKATLYTTMHSQTPHAGIWWAWLRPVSLVASHTEDRPVCDWDKVPSTMDSPPKRIRAVLWERTKQAKHEEEATNGAQLALLRMERSDAMNGAIGGIATNGTN